MFPGYFIYGCLTTLLYFIVYPIIRLLRCGDRNRLLLQRFGQYPSFVDNRPSRMRFWIHAVSVGEVGAAVPVIDVLLNRYPGCDIIVSTTTRTGRKYARDVLTSDRITIIFAPLDFIPVIHRALRIIRPDILIFMETEIWPNWIVTAHRKGIKTVLLNGRISRRSCRKYKKIKPFLKGVFQCIDVISAISVTDARRFESIGAPPERIIVNGNTKYDYLLKKVQEIDLSPIFRRYNSKNDRPVWVAGSTRTSEEAMMIDVYRKIVEKYPDTLLIIAPRHVERAYDIEKLVRLQGFSCQLRTELDRSERTAPIVIINTIGELMGIYGIADVAFCGGSLAPLGGQNILEPAFWGKPVFYGPHMDDFQDAKILLENHNAGVQVQDPLDLYKKLDYYFSHPEDAKRLGKNARTAVLKRTGAAQSHVLAIDTLLGTHQRV